MNDPSLPQTDLVDNSFAPGLLADLMVATAAPSDPGDLIGAALVVLTAREACVIRLGETLPPILEDAIGILRTAVVRADNRCSHPAPGLSEEDQLSLRGLLTLAHQHIRLLEGIDQAACGITGGDPGRCHTSDAIWNTNVTFEELLRNLSYRRDPMTGKPTGGDHDGS